MTMPWAHPMEGRRVAVMLCYACFVILLGTVALTAHGLSSIGSALDRPHMESLSMESLFFHHKHKKKSRGKTADDVGAGSEKAREAALNDKITAREKALRSAGANLKVKSFNKETKDTLTYAHRKRARDPHHHCHALMSRQ